MSLRDRLRRKPDPLALEQARDRAFELLTLNHLSDFLGYTTRPEWQGLNSRVFGRVKLIPPDFPRNSEPAWANFTAYADPKRSGKVTVAVETPSGHLCGVWYEWEGEPEEAVLSRHSIYDVTDHQVLNHIEAIQGRSPQPSDLEEMIRERLHIERADYLRKNPDERPQLDALDSAAAPAVGRPAEPELGR